MKHLRWIVPLLFLLLWATPARAQYSPIQGWCEDGNKKATVSGIDSTNPVQASYPGCTVTVIIHGGGAATIYSDTSGTPLANPFTASSNGQFIFYVQSSLAQNYDVTLSGGTPAFPAPVTIYTDIGSGGGGGGGSLLPTNNTWTGTNTWQGTFSKFKTNTDFCGPRPWRDVTCYGAIGDGVTDDSAAIQSAVTDACTSGGIVRFPVPVQYYEVDSTIVVPILCNQITFLGTGDSLAASNPQFSHAPISRIIGSASPILRADDTLGGIHSIAFNNIEFQSRNATAVQITHGQFVDVMNSAMGVDNNGTSASATALLLDGGILWFTARDSVFSTPDGGPFSPIGGRNYDPASWALPSITIAANTADSGSILFHFEDVTFAFGGVKFVVTDPAANGATYGEILFEKTVLEGSFGSPLLQFENRHTSGIGATLSRVTVIESQQADLSHPTPLVSVYGIDGSNTASIGHIIFTHSLGKDDCYVQGINGHESITGIWSDDQLFAAVCDIDSKMATFGSMVRHPNQGLDIAGPVAGPTRYAITEDDNGALRTFNALANVPDTESATSMLDLDGSLYLGPGAGSPFDLQLHRVSAGTYSQAVPVPAPTMFAATPAAGGSVPNGIYFLCIASGDRNNPPNTNSACGSEVTVTMGGGSNTINMTWVNATINTSNKYTIYIGTAPGAENKSANCTCSAAATISALPVSNNTPLAAGDLLADTFTVTPTSIKHSFGTAFNGTLTATPTAARTWTFPDASMNVVGDTTTQTITNKTVLDNTFLVANSVTPTKTAAFDLSGATATFKGTLAFTHTANRTYTFPDRTGNVCVSLGPCSVTILTATQATGTPPLAVSSTTPVANLSATPTTYNHAATQLTNAHIVSDSCTLGTDCSVTLASAAVFTSSTSYTCVAQDQTAIAAAKVAQSSGSAFAITGTGTDVIRYICIGN